ncbi:MAG: methyltransferase domain-containing protein [Parcubacteria group bacterium]|nr:methyltransferase domain-containing protein [Parcubacteria group bacterium]
MYAEKKQIEKKRRMRRDVIKNYNPSLFYLNIGSRLFVRENWRLLDYSDNSSYKAGDKGELLDYNIDLTTCPKLPISDAAVDLLFSSHVLEHLGEMPAQNVFNEAFRILKRGGIVRLVLPDADLFYDAYKRNDIEWFRGITRRWEPGWPIETHLFKWIAAYRMGTVDGVRQNVNTLSKEAFFEKYRKEIIDFTDHDFSQHITWFNFDKVKRMAERAGFKDIRHSAPRQSISEEMRATEFDTRENLSFFVDIVR